MNNRPPILSELIKNLNGALQASIQKQYRDLHEEEGARAARMFLEALNARAQIWAEETALNIKALRHREREERKRK